MFMIPLIFPRRWRLVLRKRVRNSISFPLPRASEKHHHSRCWRRCVGWDGWERMILLLSSSFLASPVCLPMQERRIRPSRVSPEGLGFPGLPSLRTWILREEMDMKRCFPVVHRSPAEDTDGIPFPRFTAGSPLCLCRGEG